jgi:hypothetical protein
MINDALHANPTIDAPIVQADQAEKTAHASLALTVDRRSIPNLAVGKD